MTNYPGGEDGSISLSEIIKQDNDDQIQAQQLSRIAGNRIHMCSYENGYHKQPLFACLTCHNKINGNNNNNGNIVFHGICLGCSMNCHLNHDVIELWDKRNFRCDCGNSKFNNVCQCHLNVHKDDVNGNNKYSDNFRGIYCYCKTIYDPNSDTMHQCANCEDWFHQKCIILEHIKCNPDVIQLVTNNNGNESKDNVDSDDDDDMKNDNNGDMIKKYTDLIVPDGDKEDIGYFICKHCAVKSLYLAKYQWNYRENIAKEESKSVSKNDNSEQKMETEMNINTNITGKRKYTDVESNEQNPVTPPTKKQRLNNYNNNNNNTNNNNNNDNNNVNNNDNNIDTKTDANIVHSSPSKNDGDTISCNKSVINEMDKNKWIKIIGGGLFLKFGFEQDLCTCDICMKTYMDNGYGFLFETNEDNNEDIDINNFKINSTEPLLAQFSTDVMMQDAISKMPRVQTIEGLYNVYKIYHFFI